MYSITEGPSEGNGFKTVDHHRSVGKSGTLAQDFEDVWRLGFEEVGVISYRIIFRQQEFQLTGRMT